jgi:hypothetical protein
MYGSDDDNPQALSRVLSSQEIDDARSAGKTFLQLMGKVRRNMSSKDRAYYELGLRAAHLEEALATGEVGRAEEHWKRLLEIASRLLTVQMERAIAAGDFGEADAMAERVMRIQRRLL